MMDDVEKVTAFNEWKANIAGKDKSYGLIEDYLLRGKLNRAGIASTLNMDKGTFEPDTVDPKAHLDEPTRVFDEFSQMLRQKGILKLDMNIKRFTDMVEKLKGEDGHYSLAMDFVSGSKLNRQKIIETFGIGKKSISGKRPENPELARMFKRFEDMLRLPEYGIVHPVDYVVLKSESKNKDLPKGALSLKQAAELNERILQLEAENEALKRNSGRFKEVAEVYRRLEQMKS